MTYPNFFHEFKSQSLKKIGQVGDYTSRFHSCFDCIGLQSINFILDWVYMGVLSFIVFISFPDTKIQTISDICK